LDGEGEETEEIAAFPGPYGGLPAVQFLMEGKLGGLAEPSPTLLNRTSEGLFPCMDEEVFLEILLAGEVLATDLTLVGPDVQVRHVDVPSKVELGRERLATCVVVAGDVVDLRSNH